MSVLKLPDLVSRMAMRGQIRNAADEANMTQDTYDKLKRTVGDRKGSKSPRSLLTESQVLAIRYNWDNNLNRDFESMAKKFLVSVDTIKLIVRNKNWKHVTLCKDPYVPKRVKK